MIQPWYKAKDFWVLSSLNSKLTGTSPSENKELFFFSSFFSPLDAKASRECYDNPVRSLEYHNFIQRFLCQSIFHVWFGIAVSFAAGHLDSFLTRGYRQAVHCSGVWTSIAKTTSVKMVRKWVEVVVSLEQNWKYFYNGKHVGSLAIFLVFRCPSTCRLLKAHAEHNEALRLKKVQEQGHWTTSAARTRTLGNLYMLSSLVTKTL